MSADVAYLPSDATGDLDDEVTGVLDAEVITVIGTADVGVRLVDAILDATPAADAPIIVNDAMRGDPAASAFGALDDDERARVMGVGPRVTTDDPDFLAALDQVAPDTSRVFAANAYDCVNLIALAAVDASSLQPRDIAGRVSSVASGGTRCRLFADCQADLIDRRNVDYDGPSGQLQLGIDGQPDRAFYDLFGYSEDGDEIPLPPLAVFA